MGRSSRISRIALLALAPFGCSSPQPCDGPLLQLDLAFSAPERVESLLITYGEDQREIIDVDGAPSLEVALAEAPFGHEVAIEVRAYDGDDIRGRLLAQGSIGPLRLDRCVELQVELTDLLIFDKDAGVADAGGDDAGDAAADAGGADAGEDAGQDAGPPVCEITADPDTLALFPFDDGEAASGMVRDVVSGVEGYANPGPLAVRSTEGPLACGTAAEFFGAGSLEIPDEGLAPASGSVDFYVRFDGPTPTAREGILSRDADGELFSGHLTFFRTCGGDLIARFQDTMQSVYRCSDRPLPSGEWVHVSLDFGAPSMLLMIDGQVQTSSGSRIANVDCTLQFFCDDPGVFDPSENRNPWVLGADSGISVEGTGEPIRAPFNGAIDQFRVSSARRAP